MALKARVAKLEKSMTEAGGDVRPCPACGQGWLLPRLLPADERARAADERVREFLPALEAQEAEMEAARAEGRAYVREPYVEPEDAYCDCGALLPWPMRDLCLPMEDLIAALHRRDGELTPMQPTKPVPGQ